MSDDVELEEWLDLTEEQQDALFQREMAEYQRMLDSMTLSQQVAYHRGRVLDNIMDNRRRLRDPKLRRIDVIDELWRSHIKSSQVRLLKLRIWRATGIYPGSTS